MALLTGYHLLGVGFAGFLFVPSARIWGKRHLYLLGTIFVIFSSAWGGGNGKNYKSLLWARIFQGIGLAPFEALVNASVGDLYFVHERGTRMALSNFAVFGGAFFTPVLVGKIADSMGYEWVSEIFFRTILCNGSAVLILPRPSISSPSSLGPCSHSSSSLSQKQRFGGNNALILTLWGTSSPLNPSRNPKPAMHHQQKHRVRSTGRTGL